MAVPARTTSLRTKINPPPPPAAPEIDIKVTNGDPNAGDAALMTLTVTWDPSAMSFGRVISPTSRVTVTTSSCTWSDYGVPWGGFKTFKLELYRKAGNTNQTYVVATATDAGSGDFDSDSWDVPAAHTQEP